MAETRLSVYVYCCSFFKLHLEMLRNLADLQLYESEFQFE